MTRAVVVGAGVAGCAAALALHRAGVEVEVRERHLLSTEDHGAFLTLATGGVRALRELGVLDAVDEVAVTLERFRVQDPTGATLAERDLGDDEDRFRLITRQRLCDVLASAVCARGVPLHRGATAVAVGSRHDGAGRRVLDERGDGIVADLVVAADGLRSTWRSWLDPRVPPPRYTGQHVSYGWSPVRVACGTPRAFHSVSGEGVAFGYIPVRHGIWWFVRLTGPPLSEQGMLDAGPQTVGALPGEVLGRIVQASTRTWSVNTYDLPTVPVWSRAGVVLLGDAAHAASPATGQGASMALEDGVVLGKAVRDHADLGRALETYEAVRRGRTQANIVASARQATPAAPLDDVDQGCAMSPVDLREQLAWAVPLRVPGTTG